MSSTPIFDSLVAERPSIWWILPLFKVKFPSNEPVFTDWSIYAQTPIVAMDPANLGFLGSAA